MRLSYHTCCSGEMSMFQLASAFDVLPLDPIQQMERLHLCYSHLSMSLPSVRQQKMQENETNNSGFM